ncbi:DinB family protein [Micromonosporaceae bacterium Da 78-11]
MAGMELGNRFDPPREAGERATLTGFLQLQRDTLAWKCADLTPEQLRTPAVAPSTMSLLGLVRHLADVERGWLHEVFAAEKLEPMTDEWALNGADADETFALWRAACTHSDQILTAAPSLDATGHEGDQSYSLRWILTHLIEEYARHNGHADLLRERLDGQTGE